VSIRATWRAFENLAVAGTSATVTGLTEGVVYYFRVRAEGEGGCPSVDSSVASVATLEHLRPEISQATVNVREGGEGRIFVRLNKDPGADVVVTLARSAGDAGLSIQDGATRNFKSSNWSSWQTVTLVEAADEDAIDETATFQVSMSGADDQFVEATALDDDIGENLALATGGSAISRLRRAYSRPEQLIDGVHASSVNYGYVVGTSATPGTITLDLKAISTVSRVRIQTWIGVRLGPSLHDRIVLRRFELDDADRRDSGRPPRLGQLDRADVAARYLRFTGESTTQGRAPSRCRNWKSTARAICPACRSPRCRPRPSTCAKPAKAASSCAWTRRRTGS
jgi:hypothetical protein